MKLLTYHDRAIDELAEKIYIPYGLFGENLIDGIKRGGIPERVLIYYVVIKQSNPRGLSQKP